jgi:hypothetical protein
MSTKFQHGSVTGKVIAVRIAGHSNFGNPTKDVTIQREDGSADIFTTTANSQLAYVIGNPEYRDHAHRFGLTAAGRLNGYADKVEG